MEQTACLTRGDSYCEVVAARALTTALTTMHADLTPLRLDPSCSNRSNWATELPRDLGAERLDAPAAARGWHLRCRHPALRVWRPEAGHEVAWVTTTGQVQIRVDLAVPEARRRVAAPRPLGGFEDPARGGFRPCRMIARSTPPSSSTVPARAAFPPCRWDPGAWSARRSRTTASSSPWAAAAWGWVVRAEDLKLKRHVALKFLPPEVGHHRESKGALRAGGPRRLGPLDHPNICTIYGIDETPDGHLFLAMACYEGESLKEKDRARSPAGARGGRPGAADRPPGWRSRTRAASSTATSSRPTSG